MTEIQFRSDMTCELVEWRTVAKNERYEVSNDGRVRLARTGKVKRGVPAKSGHMYSQLWDGERNRSVTIHSLVMGAFNGPRPFEGAEIRHLDGDPSNNHASNLAYGTKSENVRDAVKHGTHHQASKTHCPQGHEYSGENLIVIRHGDRVNRKCRICDRDRQSRYTEKRRKRREEERKAA